MASWVSAPPGGMLGNVALGPSGEAGGLIFPWGVHSLPLSRAVAPCLSVPGGDRAAS